jgi:hypothetical protein
MKKRRKRIAVVITFLILFIGIILYNKNLENFFNNKLTTLKSIKLNGLIKKPNNNEIKPNESDKAAKDVKPSPDVSPKNIVEKSIEVGLSGGIKIQAVYENKDGSNKFKYILPLDAPVSFSVNPSGDSMVILETSTQNMFYVFIDGTVQKVNDTKYISSSGDVFPKENILKSKTNFIWCSSPKFIDDNNVAYISQVPWFSRTKKYVWVFNIKDSNIKDRNDHKLYEELGGDNVKFGNLTDKGLEVIIDNSAKYIKSKGQSIEISD